MTDHGDCIGVTQKAAEQIKHFYCASCREQDQTLEIKYKHKKVHLKISTLPTNIQVTENSEAEMIQAIKRNHRGNVVNVQLVTEQRIVQDVTIAKT